MALQHPAFCQVLDSVEARVLHLMDAHDIYNVLSAMATALLTVYMQGHRLRSIMRFKNCRCRQARVCTALQIIRVQCIEKSVHCEQCLLGLCTSSGLAWCMYRGGRGRCTTTAQPSSLRAWNGPCPFSSTGHRARSAGRLKPRCTAACGAKQRIHEPAA